MKMEGILRGMIKVAAVALTAPATLAVASTLYQDFGLWQWVTAGAALVLVEGALLLGWHLLDTQGKGATPGQRGLWAALVVVAYVVLWIVALSHGEGVAGIAFRSTLGVLIVYSLAEAGILAELRSDRATDRDITNDRGVKKHRRKAEIRIAKLDTDLWEKVRADELQKHYERLSKSATMEHRKELRQMERQSTTEREGFPYPVAKLNEKKRSRKGRRLEFIRRTVKANPELSASEVVEMLQSKSGVAISTAWDDWSEFQKSEIVVSGNGNGHG